MEPVINNPATAANPPPFRERPVVQVRIIPKKDWDSLAHEKFKAAVCQACKQGAQVQVPQAELSKEKPKST